MAFFPTFRRKFVTKNKNLAGYSDKVFLYQQVSPNSLGSCGYSRTQKRYPLPSPTGFPANDNSVPNKFSGEAMLSLCCCHSLLYELSLSEVIGKASVSLLKHEIITVLTMKHIIMYNKVIRQTNGFKLKAERTVK